MEDGGIYLINRNEPVFVPAKVLNKIGLGSGEALVKTNTLWEGCKYSIEGAPIPFIIPFQ